MEPMKVATDASLMCETDVARSFMFEDARATLDRASSDGLWSE